MENGSINRQMQFECGLEIKEYKDFPGEFYILRNGRPYSPGDGFGWSHLSYAGAVRRIDMLVKAFRDNLPRRDV